MPALPLAAARAFLAGGCKGAAYALQSSNWTKSLLRQSLPVSRWHLPGSAACSAVAVSPGRAWAVPSDVTGVQWSPVHTAVCDAAFKESYSEPSESFPKIFKSPALLRFIHLSKTPLISLSSCTRCSSLCLCSALSITGAVLGRFPVQLDLRARWGSRGCKSCSGQPL